MSFTTTYNRVDPRHSLSMLNTLKHLFTTGVSITDITKQLNTQGFTGVYGGKFYPHTVRRLLRQLDLIPTYVVPRHDVVTKGNVYVDEQDDNQSLTSSYSAEQLLHYEKLKEQIRLERLENDKGRENERYS